MPHLNIGAGTDTQYARTDFSDTRAAAAAAGTPAGYDFFETLSLIHDGIEGASLPATAHATAVKQAVRDSSTYVDGPVTSGANVGEVIAKQLVNIIEAILRGETTINIIAHSRGAVAAIITTHELEGMKSAADRTQTLYDFLLTNTSTCPLTKTYLREHASELVSLKIPLSEIQDKLRAPAFKLNLFAIDPVPGGSWYGTGGFTRWTDPRFYTLPAIVNDAQIVYYNNERTRCFKPVVPSAVSTTTHLRYYNLPGHHGTGSGNLRDQARTAAFRDITEKTRLIQSLMIVKLIQFLEAHGTQFKPAFLKEFKRNPLLLYQEIYRHRESYQRFNHTTYPYLGREQAWLALIPLIGAKEERVVHYLQHTDTYLTQFIPDLDGFINVEHLELELKSTFSFESHESMRPADLLKLFRMKLEGERDLIVQPRLKEMLEHVTKSLIQLIGQQYIRNHLSLADKQQLLDEIDAFFSFLSSLASPQHLYSLATSALIETLNARLTALKECSELLQDIAELEDYEAQKQLLVTQYRDFLGGLPRIEELCGRHRIDLSSILLQRPDIADCLTRLEQAHRAGVAMPAAAATADGRPEPTPRGMPEVFPPAEHSLPTAPRLGPMPDPRSSSCVSSLSAHEESDDMPVPKPLHTKRKILKKHKPVDTNSVDSDESDFDAEGARPPRRRKRAQAASAAKTRSLTFPRPPLHPPIVPQLDPAVKRLLYGVGIASLAFAVCFSALFFGHVALIGLSVLAGALFISTCVSVVTFALNLIVQLWCLSHPTLQTPKESSEPPQTDLSNAGWGRLAQPHPYIEQLSASCQPPQGCDGSGLPFVGHDGYRRPEPNAALLDCYVAGIRRPPG